MEDQEVYNFGKEHKAVGWKEDNLQNKKAQCCCKGIVIREWGGDAEQRAQEETHTHMKKIYNSWDFKSLGERNYF